MQITTVRSFPMNLFVLNDVLHCLGSYQLAGGFNVRVCMFYCFCISVIYIRPAINILKN